MCRSKNNSVPDTIYDLLFRTAGSRPTNAMPRFVTRNTQHATRITQPVLRLALFLFLALISTAAFAQPANDNFVNAQPLQGPSGAVPGNNDGGTREVGEPLITGAPGGASIWYAWTAPNGGAYSFTTLGSAISDTVLGVFTGNAVNNITLVAQNDDIDPLNTNYLSSVTFNARAGTTYYIVVDSYDATVETGDINLNWGPQQLYGGDFSFTSPLYIFSENDSAFGPADPFMTDAADPLLRARVTVTRRQGYTGRVLIDYTITNAFYTNIFITNLFGTNLYTTNIDLCGGQNFFTNFIFTNVTWTNFFQNNEYGQFVYFTQSGGYTHSCTNGNLIDSNYVEFCSTTVTGPPLTNQGFCLNISFPGTNVFNTTSNNCGGTNSVYYQTNIFCYSVFVTNIVPSAEPFLDYLPISSTVTNNDFQMSVDLPYQFIPSSFFSPPPLVNKVLIASIDNVYLDPLESTDIAPPTLNIGPTNTLINILQTSGEGGSNNVPSGLVDFHNPEIGLQPGSDYATPNDVAGFSSSPVDYTNVAGTLTFGPNVVGRPIDIPITDDNVVEFNEDFLLQLWLPEGTPPTTASLGYARD